MRQLLFTGCVLVLFPSVPATPVHAASVPRRAATPAPTAAPARRMAAASLYSRRSRRLVQSYLRLKVLEMRERDLERARKVVERKLGLRALLGETPVPDDR
ncbi:MAG TPA: hypothetical protein VHT05_12790 [Candidatus Elarobacter sp.]|nr:hypothetical protein [Candidatus Elarobacter sp.]